jgi:hypothetical protein
MSDPTELTKLLDPKTVRRFYKDALSAPAQELGALSADVIKGIGLLAAPFKLMAAWDERFKGWLKEVVSRVPPERQTEAPADVAGQIFEKLRYIEDGSVLSEMFLNLLTASIDKDRQGDAHPAFPQIIGQLSPEEALFLFDFAQVTPIKGNLDSRVAYATETVIKECLPNISHINGNRLYAYLDHFEALGLLNQLEDLVAPFKNKISVHVELTNFGEFFVRVCLPDKDRVERMRAVGKPSI